MQNTLENKANFFAQYYNQFVMKIPSNEDKLRVFDQWILSQKSAYLELKPLSQISDEDAFSIGCLMELIGEASDMPKSYRDHLIGLGKHISSNRNNLYSDAVDYLRSKGYALPYNGVSVETLIEWGWITLKPAAS